MKKFKNLSIQLKILVGIGVSFLVAMLLLMGIVIYQFEDLLVENKELLEDELLERKQDKYKSLVQTRAKILAQVYAENQADLNQLEMKNLLSEINKEAGLEDNYFFIYRLDGTTVSLPPAPELEGTNRWELEVEGRYLLKELVDLVGQGGGKITYPYTNPNTGEVETKFGYAESIAGTNLFVGSGGYASDFYSLLDIIKLKITERRNDILYLLIMAFLLVILIVFFVIIRTSNYITTNINNILAGFNQIGSGKLEFRLPQKSKDEFGKLILGFNYMLDRIKDLTYNDPLTGLPNMNFLQGNLDSDLEELNSKEENLYLFTLNVENLNLINSNYGYQMGNKLLREIFKRLDKVIEQEIVIARKSDEFIFYFKSELEKEGILDLSQQTLQKLFDPYSIDDKLIYAKPRIGVAQFKKEESCDQLIKKSKLALHFVSRNEANILFYEPAMRGQLSNRMNLESQMRLALEREEFILHYQPLVDARSDKIVGLEALIRWEHPQEGMISPGKFIPLAEDTGMIIELGLWVLKEACRQLREWRKAGYHDILVSVNIAPQEFQQPDFVEEVKMILEETSLKPGSLELEITERTAIENVDYTINTLKELNKLGIRIAIDDFGTGYSSLEYLSEFALDRLKIDRAFIQNQSNEGIVKTIIMIGDNLNLEVLAEGVETEAELDFLLANNCFLYQGYLFSKPLAASDILKLLIENR